MVVLKENDTVLLVKAEDGNGESGFMLPTGNVEVGETPEQSAQRVVRELSGVSIKPELATLVASELAGGEGEFAYCYLFLVRRMVRHNHSVSDWKPVAKALEDLHLPSERACLALAVKKRYETDN